jgi:hypothetical protein
MERTRAYGIVLVVPSSFLFALCNDGFRASSESSKLEVRFFLFIYEALYSGRFIMTSWEIESRLAG